MFTWHFTFAGQDAVHDLAARCRGALAQLPGLDLVPDQWLHLTTQGLAFTDEISGEETEAVISAARDWLAEAAPLAVELGPLEVTPEAIRFGVQPADGLAAVRRELRSAITGALGAERLMEADDWTPHVTVAYSHTTAPAAPYKAAAGGSGTAAAVIGRVELITLSRDERMYEWTTRAVVPLDGGPVRRPAG